MTFDETLAQIRELLQSKGRVAYRALKRRFELDDEYLEDLKAELIDAEQVARDEDSKVLVWVGAPPVPSSKFQVQDSPPPTPGAQHPSAERRQLTVMFCDLVGSTALSTQLDPEELREVVRAYQDTCTEVVRRYDGQIAQHLGDGLLVYFGYPTAHEDDAQRAVRTGLEIVSAIQTRVPSPLVGEGQGEGAVETRRTVPLQVRIGIHTGPVVVGEIGSGEKREQLALGEPPNIAARLQGLAAPNAVVISAATQRLVAGLFDCQDLGLQTLKGISTPVAVYQVLGEGTAQSRFEAAVQSGLTPLVGRELEMARKLAEQLLRLAQSVQDLYLLSLAHAALGCTLYWLGELTLALPHLEQAIALYDPQKRRFGQDPGVACLCHAAWTIWALGYLNQALKRSQEAMAIAQELSHPLSLAQALIADLRIHQLRREVQAAQRRAEALITLSTEQGFAFTLAWGTIMQRMGNGGTRTKEAGNCTDAPRPSRLAGYGITGAPIILPRASGRDAWESRTDRRRAYCFGGGDGCCTQDWREGI